MRARKSRFSRDLGESRLADPGRVCWWPNEKATAICFVFAQGLAGGGRL